MGSIARSGTWDEASSPAATRLARRFEDAWKASHPRRRPDPADYLPGGPDATPAAWLALLRADLNLRWDAGEAVRVECYRDAHPGLDAETMVALCYEEFCRREEDGEAPFPPEYDERFPDLSDRLRRVFDIHELVGNAASTDLHVPGPELAPFPEAAQTIAGFHLVEELGRGSFARVFLAQERQLADRPVALKVARTGSREPQTLARLQHTHIVPVHSYRTDPATGLHLLCMPYFGRVTLGRLLADDQARVAPTGLELLAVLDRLDPTEASAGRQSSARATLSRLPVDRAIAWWGARLAEALAHAHDRGILHRDIKPSNVLVTGDGLPMLLDFNLAGEPWAERQGLEPENLGGTLAYMAPEHLEAVARGEDEAVDRRSDVFSLGVLLYEALTGARPFPPPSTCATVPDALRQAAEDRRLRPAPRLRESHPEIASSLERVIARCLAPDPGGRFPTAADLALDLQAVADDAPLRSTREPILVRLVRLGRRSWKKLALAVPLAVVLVGSVASTVREGEERLRLDADASSLLKQGTTAYRLADYPTAKARFEAVRTTTAGRPELAAIRMQASVGLARVEEVERVRKLADEFSVKADALRYDLIEPMARVDRLSGRVHAALAPFRVEADPDWSRAPELTWLEPSRKARLVAEVEELLFLVAVGRESNKFALTHTSIQFCDRGMALAGSKAPWLALRAWLDEAPPVGEGDDPSSESSALTCSEWAALRDRQGRAKSAAAWLDRAIDLAPGDPWTRSRRAALAARLGEFPSALRHLDVAVALALRSPRFYRERAVILRSVGDWARAKDDEDRAAGLAPAR